MSERKGRGSRGPRGRASRGPAAAAAQTKRPGEPSGGRVASAGEPQVGRGRGRAARAPVQQVQQIPSATPPPQIPPQQGSPQVPVQQLSKMSIQQEPQIAQTGPPKEPTPPSSGASVGRSTGRGYGELVTKPPHMEKTTGEMGTPISVMSNFIALTQRPNCAIYQYHVNFSPPVENKRLRVALVYQKEDILGKTRSFDGMILHLPKKLPEEITEYSCKLRDESIVKVTITLTNELSADSPVCLQLYNILFRKVLNDLGMSQIGRHFYDMHHPIQVPQHKLELWPGFITSILRYDAGIMLCADVSHKILRTDTVLDYLHDLGASGRRNFHETASKNLIGEIVLTRYNNNTYRIDEIDWNSSPRSTFTRNGTEVSFSDYYLNKYQQKITDLGQPLLVSRPNAREIRARGGNDSPFLLIPELCTRTGLSEEARADFRVMKDLGEHTRVSPDSRHRTLTTFLQNIDRTPACSELLKNWNIKFDNDLVKFGGRIMAPEKIFQTRKQLSYNPQEADWSRDMRGNILVSAVTITDSIIYFCDKDAQNARAFSETLVKVCAPMGIRMSPPRPQRLPDDRTGTILNALGKDLSGNRNVQLVICVLPNNRKDRYDAIKKLCCKDQPGSSPVLSQCILGRTVSKQKMLMSVSTKVAMQINCKLGGELWALEIPIKNCMVIGVDTYHDSSRKGRSVGGFIASTNKNLTKYYSQTMFQSTGQELANNMKSCMANALRHYHTVNQTLPDKIIVYRDGVGDGQLAAVVEHEIPQFKDCFKEHTDYKPKFAFVVVKKRISARIFQADRKLSNPPPGTVIDNTITKSEWYDFFLVSQSVRQGTVTPTHFNVVHDTSGLKPDHMQKLAYKLCHLYYNWAGTVRVPAPCQYAHKLAFLVGQSIHDYPSDTLQDKLYYL